MSTSLASLVDHLSKVGNTNFKKFMERYNTKSECQYIKHKNNNLIYNLNNVIKHIADQSVYYQKSLLPHTNFVTKISINLCCY